MTSPAGNSKITTKKASMKARHTTPLPSRRFTLHCILELSSDSDSAYDSAFVASAASVNQPQAYECLKNKFNRTHHQQIKDS